MQIFICGKPMKIFSKGAIYFIGLFLVAVSTAMINAPVERLFSVPSFLMTLGVGTIVYAIAWSMREIDERG